MAAMIEKLERAEARDGGPPASGEELKRRLTEHYEMRKRPNDLVRITQVSGHNFRVNTLSPRMSDHEVMATYHIVKSEFLHAEERDGELVITDQTRY